MGATRRGFLKGAGLATVGAGLGLPILGPARLAALPDAARDGGPLSRLAMVVDVDKCRLDGVRQACIEACERAHNVPRLPDPAQEVQWIWSETFGAALPDQVHAHTPAERREAPVLVLCNHCDEPPCVKVCPTGATWKREADGIVMMDMHRCVGCRYCMAACPYGARSFNWRDPQAFVPTRPDGSLYSNYPMRTRGVVEKCTFCAERLRDGLQPACVEAANSVPGGQGALVFGDPTDPSSEVSRLLRERHTVSRRPGLGTGPNVYYVAPAGAGAAADRAGQS